MRSVVRKQCSTRFHVQTQPLPVCTWHANPPELSARHCVAIQSVGVVRSCVRIGKPKGRQAHANPYVSARLPSSGPGHHPPDDIRNNRMGPIARPCKPTEPRQRNIISRTRLVCIKLSCCTVGCRKLFVLWKLVRGNTQMLRKHLCYKWSCSDRIA